MSSTSHISATATKPTPATILAALTQPRILDLARVFGVRLRAGSTPKKQLAQTLGTELAGNAPVLLRELGREELQSVCLAHGIPDAGTSRRELLERVLIAAGFDPSRSVPPVPTHLRDGLPSAGQVVRARHRQWLVEQVVPGEGDESPLVKLVCLDDDAPGRALDVLWDLELGAEVVEPETRGLGTITKLDPPSHFGAYLHTLRWNAVSAADATRFQAPFRAGIKHMAHQLTPLMKALELPRSNLFIADDVGLGKTIEAGLVLQELILRQQADFVLIACPASICLQWRDEMRRRFGLHFEVMTRQFIASRRQQRGFGVNPWTTHNRFIISHSLLRRPEYREPLSHHLGARARKSLLILDEAHVAAPASRSRYAVDSEVTHTIRELAPRFDNRLFLSATPHNGHSNSFSALLEILDPVRFNRLVPVKGKEDLAPIMVRRLKRDLLKLGIEQFPERVLVQHDLTHAGSAWQTQASRSDGKTSAPVDLGQHELLDLELADLLAKYTELCAPKKGRGRLPFIRLQQRLLSSPEAFARSLEVHAQAVDKRGGPVAQPVQLEIASVEDPETHGEADEVTEAEELAKLAAETANLPSLNEQARALLSTLRAKAERARRLPDAKVRSFMAWLRENACPALGDKSSTTSRTWTDRRVLVFTEWADTKRYLVELLTEAAEHTDRGDVRIATFQGGMNDEAREDIQRRFNAPPDEEPLRILIATDAAREGINLQAFCADVFHFDLPWNPSRLEQRNGRIDRTLQPAKEVRCHYFNYPDRAEDRVLQTLVRKVDIVQRELGSLGDVLLKELADELEDGIHAETAARIDQIGKNAATKTVEQELEEARKDEAALSAEIHTALRRYEASQRALEVDPDALQGVFEVGLRLAGAAGLVSNGPTPEGHPSFRMPPLDRSWEITLDTIRRPRKRGEDFLDWRKEPPRPVTFTPVARLSSDVEQLHLAHPLVRRVLDRFLAQGFSAHDLSRVSAVVAPKDSVVRVVVFARLSLFGPGAARLHDEIVGIAAAWNADPSAARIVEPYRDPVTNAKAIEQVEHLLATGTKAPSKKVKDTILSAAPDLFAALWRPLHDEADARAVRAKAGLATRARKEADDLRTLLTRQRDALDKRMRELRQGELYKDASDLAQIKEQQRQLQLDLEHADARRKAIEHDLEVEPDAIAALYAVRMVRVSPVGLVVSWPEAAT